MLESRLGRTAGSRSFSRRVALVSAAFLLASTWSSRAAQASCGDYVMLGHGGEQGLHADAALPGQPAKPACHGPHCQRGLPLPAPFKLPVRIAGVDAWFGFELAAKDVVCAANSQEPGSLFLPSGMPARIDRPPKGAL